MRLSDVASGLLILVSGVGVAAVAVTFPPMPGQPVGPALFPTIIGLALVVLGGVLALSGARRRSGPLVIFDDWVRKPRMVVHFVLVIASLLFYALAVDRLGFIPTAFVFLAVMFVAFGVGRRWIVPAALTATLVIHYGFYTLLRVPLPWGVLEGIAW